MRTDGKSEVREKERKAGDIQDDRQIAEEERGMLHLSGLTSQSSS